MKKKSILACLMLCVGLSFAACSKEDKAEEPEETEVQQEVVDFEAQAESVPEQEPVAMEMPVVEEAPAPVEEVASVEEPAPAAEEALPAEPAPEAQSDYTVEETGETTLYTTDSLKMRKGPSSDDFEVIGVLKKGSQITANGKVNGYKGDGKTWYRIKRTDSDEPAFVAGDYVSSEKPKEEKPAEAAPAATTADAAATDAAAKAQADAAAKAAADAAAKAAADQAAAAAAAAPAAAPAAVPATPAGGDAPKNGHKYPDSKIAADWDRTGAIAAGKKWAELDEGTKEACRTHYDDHGCSGW